MDFSTIGSHSSSLSYPNGSEEWIYGNNETVLWDTSQITGSTVDLYVLHDDPSDLEQNYQSYNYLLSIKNWYQFASNVSNTGSYTVDPDDLNGEGNRYIVLISSSNGNWDVSNRTFSLIPSSGGPGGSEGEVNIPNGGSGSSSGETGGGDTF
jgi:hypothetical protein